LHDDDDDDDDDDVTTGDALCLGCPVQHAPGELTRDSGSMSLGASLLQGSHSFSNHNGDNGSNRRTALCNDDDDATDDALHSGILFGMHLVISKETQVECC
jgi:hypothetical protein